MQLAAEFNEQWEAGQIAGWMDKGEGHAGSESGMMDLEAFTSADELEILGQSGCLGRFFHFLSTSIYRLLAAVH
jgi:hypothetical protein